jgi:hypothetical protein
MPLLYSIHYSFLISSLHYPIRSSLCLESGLLASDFEGSSLLSLLAQCHMVLVSQHRRLAPSTLHLRSRTATCRASAKEREAHLVGIFSQQRRGVTRRQGHTPLEGAVQLQAQGIYEEQVILDLYLLGLFTIKSQQLVTALQESNEMS